MRLPRVLLIVLMIAVVGFAAFGCGGPTGVPETDYQALQSKLDTAQQSLSDSQAQVTKLQQDLAAAQADSTRLQGQLAEATSNQTDSAALAQLQQQYQASSAQVDALTAQLADASNNYDAAKAQIDSYVAQIADLQQQIDELSATPTPLPTLALTAANIQSALWNRINQERTAAGVSQLTVGTNLVQWTAQHVQQMVAVQHTTTYTDSAVGIQAVNMAIGYLSVSEVVDATILFWKIYPAWYSQNILAPYAAYGSLSVAQSGGVFYISFMASDFP
jgi:small-conductance mechanosensitive channel